MTNADYSIATEDVVDALKRENPLLSTDAAYATATVVLTALETEGWLLEPPTCDYANGPKTVVCENPTRPGQPYCPEHGR